MGVFDLKKGDRAIVKSVSVDGAAGERLQSLGIKRGVKIEIISFSLFKGSVLIGVGYNRVAVRKSVAQRIEVDIC